MVLEGDDMEGEERMLLVRNHLCSRFVLYASPTHSCFNAFSRVDVRVDVKIPGGVQAYVVDLRGERCVSERWTRDGNMLHSLSDMKLLLRSGKKPSYPLSFVPFSTPTIPRTGWKRTGNSIQSPTPRANSVSFKLQRLYS